MFSSSVCAPPSGPSSHDRPRAGLYTHNAAARCQSRPSSYSARLARGTSLAHFSKTLVSPCDSRRRRQAEHWLSAESTDGRVVDDLPQLRHELRCPRPTARAHPASLRLPTESRGRNPMLTIVEPRSSSKSNGARTRSLRRVNHLRRLGRIQDVAIARRQGGRRNLVAAEMRVYRSAARCRQLPARGSLSRYATAFDISGREACPAGPCATSRALRRFLGRADRDVVRLTALLTIERAVIANSA